MKILVLSDSHSRFISDIDFNKYDYIIHAGDFGASKDVLEKLNNCFYVCGNCDWGKNKERLIEINNKNIYLTHGDLYHVKYHLNSLIYKAIENKANIAIFGHTHEPTIFVQDNILFINPGAYIDGYYAIITDNAIEFYKDGFLKRKFDYKW